MPDDDQKPFTSNEELKAYVRAFLREHPLAAFTTVSAEGKPQVSTMYFYVDDDLTFYLFSLKDSTKVRNLMQNRNAGIAVGFGPARIAVQSGGTATIASEVDADAFYQVLDALQTEALNELPIVKLARFARQDHEQFVLIRFVPEWLSFLNFDVEGHPESYYHDYQSVIP